MKGFEHLTVASAAKMGKKATRCPASARPRSVKGVGRLDLADTLLAQIVAVGLPQPVREFRPFADRRFRIDLAWPDQLIFAEVDGAEWTYGRHSRGAGMQTDCEKWNRLTLEDWIGFRFTGSQVRNGYALRTIEQMMFR